MATQRHIDTKTRLSLEDFFLQNFQPLAWKHRISGSLKRGPTYLNSASKLISPTKSRANLKLQWFPPSCLTVMDFYSNKIAFRLEIIQKFASRLSGFEIVTDTKIRLRKWIFFSCEGIFYYDENNEIPCSWFKNTVSHKIDFKAVWPRNDHASLGVNISKLACT